MLELAILGFLAEEPLHGYELRRRVEQLSGYARPLSDGSLYPAITRLVRDGLLARRSQPEAGDRRHVLTLTESGRADLLRRLAAPGPHDVTDMNRWFTVLAFLSLLPDPAQRRAVLEQRLHFLEQRAGFFGGTDSPQRLADTADPYRRGMLVVARASSTAERAWLRGVIDHTGPPTDGAETSDPPKERTR